MEPIELAKICREALADKKAEDIVVLDVEQLVSYAAYFVVATGRSERQVRALIDHVRGTLRAQGRRALGSEGTDRGTWALIDYGDVVVHVFRDQERYFYDLEGLWQDAPRVDVDGDASATPTSAAAPG